MSEAVPGNINTSPEQYALAVQLLEKFRHANDAEADEAIEALRNGNPSELQIEVALGEIKNLKIRSKSLTQPEYGNAFLQREILNESELASHFDQLQEAENALYEILVKINPARSRGGL